jgi:ankyrin repeat protein
MDNESQAVTNLVDDRKYDAAFAAIRERVASGVGIDEIRDTRYTGNPPIWVRMLDDGQADAVKFAILAGADVNARSCIGKTALSMAAEKGFAEIVELLIGRGANVNAPCESDDPLSAAAKKGYGAIVDALLAAGADVNKTNEYGHTPLMAAAISGDEAIMRRLVSAGASPKSKDKMGRVAMYYAVANKKTTAIEYLTSLGAGAARPEKLQAIYRSRVGP